jgi:FAD:protein FMN transferase
MQRWAGGLRAARRPADPPNAELPPMLLAAPDPSAVAPLPLRGLFASPRPATAAGWVKREEAIMGTAISVQLWADDARTGAAACAAVMQEMHRIDHAMSPYKASSELSRINREAGERPILLGEEMFALLGRAQEFAALSQGAFDITFAAAGQLYDYRAGVRPDAEALAAARAAIGWRSVELDGRTRSVRFLKPGMRIDLGGFAKGYAVDNAITLLERLGIRHAYVAAGGDSRVLGRRNGRPWTVAVADPRRAGEVVAVLPLEDTAISTSGDYERYFEERDGAGRMVRHHHLIDPATGRSPRDVRSVTVLAPDGLTAEALSKTLFVLGPKRGLELLETIPGVDAVIIDANGRLHASPGLINAGSAPARQGENA